MKDARKTVDAIQSDLREVKFAIKTLSSSESIPAPTAHLLNKKLHDVERRILALFTEVSTETETHTED